MWQITDRMGRQKGGAASAIGWTVYDKYGRVKTTANAGIFNALDFGADDRGILESTTALQMALDAAKEAGGARVWLPPGLYRVAGLTLTDADHISIQGAGAGRTVLQLIDDGNATLLYLLRCNHLTISDLEIDGNKANQNGNLLRGIQWMADNAASGGVLCEHGTFERLYIHDTRDQGLIVAGGRFVKIDKVDTARCGSAAANVGAGIYVAGALPDVSLLSADVQIANCSDYGSGLDGATGGDLEGAGLQMQVGTQRIQVNNYASWYSLKYGIKCQASQVELANVQIYEPAVAGLALQYDDIRAANVRVQKSVPASIDGISINAPQQAADPRDIRMELANVHLVGQGFYTGLAIENTIGAVPVAHVHVVNLDVQGAAGVNYGVRIRGNVRDCSIAHAHITDCDTNINQSGYTIGGVAYSPENINYTDVHSGEVQAAGAAGSIGWACGYGTALLMGCTSEVLAGSSRVLWQNLNHNWAVSCANRLGLCVTPAETQPTRTIATGVIAAGRAGYIEVHPESGNADTLTDISGGTVGQMLTLKSDTGDTITLTHDASRLILPGATDYTLSGDKRLLLYCLAAGKWTVFNA